MEATINLDLKAVDAGFEVGVLRAEIAAMKAAHDRRVTELLEANNRYQQEARDARAACTASGEAVSTAARDVLAERRRQVEVEGYTPEHDDAHDRGELAGAAAAYAAYRSQVAPEVIMGDEIIGTLWPWPGEGSYKPKNRYDDLKRAAAFLIAEMDRLNRLAAREVSL